jgi:4-amino-4-deoxy-L-arabinose transferase-like glycosyltransferase
LLAYNMKLPGTYLAYAALMAIFGQTTAGIHAGLLAVNLLSILLLYRLSRRVFEPIAAGGAALSFSVLSVSPAVLGMAGHATHFVTLFAIAGALALYRTNQSARLASVLASGLLFGLAFLMKQQGIFLVGFGAAYLLYLAYGRHAIARRRLPLLLGAYTAGAVLPYLLICLWLGYAGVWSRFVPSGYLSTEYRRVGVVDVRRDGPSQYRWDNEAEGYRRSPGRSVTVYRRKSDN